MSNLKCTSIFGHRWGVAKNTDFGKDAYGNDLTPLYCPHCRTYVYVQAK